MRRVNAGNILIFLLQVQSLGNTLDLDAEPLIDAEPDQGEDDDGEKNGRVQRVCGLVPRFEHHDQRLQAEGDDEDGHELGQRPARLARRTHLAPALDLLLGDVLRQSHHCEGDDYEADTADHLRRRILAIQQRPGDVPARIAEQKRRQCRQHEGRDHQQAVGYRGKGAHRGRRVRLSGFRHRG